MYLCASYLSLSLSFGLEICFEFFRMYGCTLHSERARAHIAVNGELVLTLILAECGHVAGTLILPFTTRDYDVDGFI